MAHSLSWYRKGDRYPGSKLYARTWTPDDPNGPVQPLYANNNAAKTVGNHSSNNSSNPSQLQNQSSNQSNDEFNVSGAAAGGEMGDAGAAASIFGSGGATGL